MKKWVYHSSPSFSETYLKRLQAIPREKDLFQYFIRTLSWVCMQGMVRLYFRLKIVDKSRMKTEGSRVLIANHTSHLDIFALLASLSFRDYFHLHIAAAQDAFYTNRRRSLLTSLLLNTFPFDRKHYGLRGLKHCKQVLETPGEILLIFPEGARSRSGKVRPFKEGIGYLLAGRSIPVIPAGIRGGKKAWPVHAKFPRPSQVELVLGPPLTFSHLPKTKEGIKTVTQTLKQEVIQCLQKSK